MRVQWLQLGNLRRTDLGPLNADDSGWLGQFVGVLAVRLGAIPIKWSGFLEPISYEEITCSA